MKKIYAVNGSPRSNGNTAEVLYSALRGAAANGASTAFVDLGNLKFSGCQSCFACKRKDSPCRGRCVLQDDLSAILDEIFEADAVIMGSPIYFGGESGLYRNAFERIFFPAFQYTNPPSTLAKKKVDFAFVYTMNVTPGLMDEYKYAENLAKAQEFPQLVYNSAPPEVLYVCDTFQFSDYSLYESSMFDADAKKVARQETFPQDLQKAYELGKKLALS